MERCDGRKKKRLQWETLGCRRPRPLPIINFFALPAERAALASPLSTVFDIEIERGNAVVGIALYLVRRRGHCSTKLRTAKEMGRGKFEKTRKNERARERIGANQRKRERERRKTRVPSWRCWSLLFCLGALFNVLGGFALSFYRTEYIQWVSFFFRDGRVATKESTTSYVIKYEW